MTAEQSVPLRRKFDEVAKGKRRMGAFIFRLVLVALMLLMEQEQCRADDGPPHTCRQMIKQTCNSTEGQVKWDYAGILVPSTESSLDFKGKSTKWGSLTIRQPRRKT